MSPSKVREAMYQNHLIIQTVLYTKMSLLILEMLCDCVSASCRDVVSAQTEALPSYSGKGAHLSTDHLIL